MRILLRWDDFGACGRESIQHDEALIDFCMSHKFPMLVGITPLIPRDPHDAQNTVFYPFEDDQRRIALVRETLRHGWQLGLHGYNHQRSFLYDWTEFDRQSYRTQNKQD